MKGELHVSLLRPSGRKATYVRGILSPISQMIASVKGFQTCSVPLISVIPSENFDFVHKPFSIAKIGLLRAAHMLTEAFLAELSGEHIV